MTQPMPSRPLEKPHRPQFGCGPCVKRPGWTIDCLNGALLGRSHRQGAPRERLREVIQRSRDLAGLPDDWRLAIVPASDTGAVEMALWSLLGPRPVDVLAFDTFTKAWATDIADELKIAHHLFDADYGHLPTLGNLNPEHDWVFAWNGTSSGVRVPGIDWLPKERAGLTICDATSAIFAMPLPFDRLDVVTWSWQKALGGEAAHGMLAVSPRAVERLESYQATWPVPKLFRLTKNGRLNTALFDGFTTNTPSMLCVEDALDGLRWAESVGGLPELWARTERNFHCVWDWVQRTEFVRFLARDLRTLSPTSICLEFTGHSWDSLQRAQQKAFLDGFLARLEQESVAYDIRNYRDAPLGLRLWGGPTIECADLQRLVPWLDWSYWQQAQQMGL